MSQTVDRPKTKLRKKPSSSESQSGDFLRGLSSDFVLEFYDLMVKSRMVEERMIKLYKTGFSYFWIGAPGEEAFGVALGLLVNKGKGLNHDWLHLHYRGTPTLIAMGMPIIDPIRLTMNKATDRHAGGRNFSNHYCIPEWNVAPVTSPIETQYSTAIGTAWSQRRSNSKGITIVTGGDAGSAEGDFASSLIWSSRPNQELPMLITIQNNRWGISTSYDTQHGEKNVSDRGTPFGLRTTVIDGNDPIECYLKLKDEFDYVRKERKPSVVEIEVSRLYGHSSATGANYVKEENDCLKDFEKKLIQEGLISEDEVQKKYDEYSRQSIEAAEQAKKEPDPTPESIWENIYANGENGDWRKF